MGVTGNTMGCVFFLSFLYVTNISNKKYYSDHQFQRRFLVVNFTGFETGIETCFEYRLTVLQNQKSNLTNTILKLNKKNQKTNNAFIN